MLHRRRAPLFAGFAVALVAVAGSAGAQTPPQPTMPAALPATGLPATGPSANSAADPFAVTGVKVDVNAANANAARDQAIREAQVKAWAELYKRLVPGGSAPRVSDNDLARLVQGFEIDDEKVSATRYVGSITVRFRPNAVREAIGGSASAQYVEPPSRPFVVLPVTVVDGTPVLWQDRTAWRAAWEERPASSNLVPLVVPDGELPDVQAISAEEALAGNQEALARIAQRYRAGGVIVARTEMGGNGPDLARGMTVEVTRYMPDGVRDTQTVNVKADGSDRPNDFLSRAVTFVGASLDDSWRRDNMVATGPEQTTLVRVPLARLEDWVETRKRLTGIAGLTRTDVVSLTRSEALVSLTHRGDPERLRQSLARRDLGLTRSTAGGVPGAMQPVPGQPTADWQLTLLPRGSGEQAGAVAPAGGAGAATPLTGSTPFGAPASIPAPSSSSGAAATPSGLGAPPRNLGTLPVGSVRQ
ncbi:DUF2066 domain-containing protein [Azospirillum thermophilum]|uniref:DUF2066 domain-containing protein n=1 Tax=Azospirillum thermophilum TaxID=2202148 RepID=A0A2S2CR31_9PROT|nr:DUF2066 domain-containing protein [Azospirillum thermophilum]AWK86909.1 DUF2066 domain-containing protein [Azospirillum thermophilum]